MNEIERIKYVYQKRKVAGKGKDWIPFNKACFYSWSQRDCAVVEAIKKNGFSELGSMKILDVGWGKYCVIL